MRFKTFVLTRKKIVITVSTFAAVITAAVAVTAFANSAKTTEVFKNGMAYKAILEDGLPAQTRKEISLDRIVKSAIGFDSENPQTIIEEYSASFTQQNPDNIAENAEEPHDEPQPEPTAESDSESIERSEPVFPSREQLFSSVGLTLSNATKYEVNIDNMCSEDVSFPADENGPQVLVIHTHTTECYNGGATSGESDRTTDDSKNVIEVGNVICQTLEENGIKTYHDTTYHDYPSYQGAYTRALTTIGSRLSEYPSINVVLDIHRDAFVYSDGSKLAVTCDENGVRTAQVMLICGTDSMGLEHSQWRENLKLAAKIQNAADIMYPGLMRPVNLRTERFNMHMTKGSLLLEVGSNGNTLEEAKNGGRDVARAIAAVLKNQ